MSFLNIFKSSFQCVGEQNRDYNEKSANDLRPQVLLSIPQGSYYFNMYQQVIEHLKVYIKDKKLVDPDNPTKIICENDILEKVFGCKEFLTENVW